jgi:hypothetical protein
MRLRGFDAKVSFALFRRREMLWALAITAWCGSVAAGVGALQRYKSQPAVAPQPPLLWPAASRLLRSSSRPTLVLVAHPRCPCTRATLHELAVLMSQAGERLSAHVLFVRPAGAPRDWEKGELWQAARAVPGVTTSSDEGGREARLFHAATSGQVLLFDASGKQIFAGGITGARGHEGDNPGRSRVLSLISKGRAELARAPVFGCDLENPEPPPNAGAARP